MCVCENYQGLFYKIIHTYHCFILFQSLLSPNQLKTVNITLSKCLKKIFYVGCWIFGVSSHLSISISLQHYDDDNDTIHVQVVIERPSLRPGQGAATKETDEDVVLLYIAQLAALAVLLTAMWGHVSLVSRLIPILICPLSSDYSSSSASGEAWSSSSARSHGCSV